MVEQQKKGHINQGNKDSATWNEEAARVVGQNIIGLIFHEDSATSTSIFTFALRGFVNVDI